MPAGRPWLHDGLKSRVGEDDQIGPVEQAGRVGRRVPPHPQRRRHPPARLDQRPARPHRRADRACCATASASAPGPGRRCCTPDCGVRVVSWNHRGTGGSDRPPTRNRVGIEEFVEDALSVMDHFGVDQRRADGLVDGRQHGVRAGPAPPRAGHRRSSRSRACPATRSPPCSARCACRTAWRARLTVSLSRALQPTGRR